MQPGRALPLAGLVVLALAGPLAADDAPLRVLAIGGSSGSHRPSEMLELFQQGLAGSEIVCQYTEDLAALTDGRLRASDVLLIYKDDGDLSAAEEGALLEFVRGGRGLVAVHCASHCFRASDAYTRLVGGRFHHHGAEVFRARIVDAQHPLMAGLTSLESWDETYVHDQLSSDRRVLMCRPEQGGYEPYTWVRREGQGRVVYTALGHDQRTWQHPGFQQLVRQSLRWAAGRLGDAEQAAEIDGPAPYQAPVVEPLSAEQSLARMHLPEGFRVELFAAEPDVVKPLAMAFDERGRAWIIESTDYPNTLLDPDGGHDRIKICEDTDGDGRADKFTVFAEGLNIPTGLLRYGRGVIVARAPDILFLEDTDGDDRADRRQVLYTGFNRFDTHAVHSNLHWGFDGWVWATIGYSGAAVRIGDQQVSMKQSIFRFRPDGSAMEVLTPTSNNTWGLGFSESGDVFASTANNQHSVHLAIPNRYYESVRGWHGVGSAGIEDHKRFHHISADLRQVDHHGGYTAASGHELVTAGAFPAEYRNRAALVCEPTGHLIHIDWLVPRGSGFVARDGFNLLASTDPWTAPIQATVGPDGAVWWLDWYNFIVRHNPTPPGYETGPGNAYVTPERDRTHGRIYRIVCSGAGDALAGSPEADSAPAAPAIKQSPAPVSLAGADTAALLDALGNDNLFWRLTAQRLLLEQNAPELSQRLLELIAQRLPEKRPDDPQLAHAVWTLGSLSATAPEVGDVLRAAQGHPAPAVRRAALATMPREIRELSSLLSGSRLSDPDLGVRLAALLTMAEMPAAEYAARAIVAAALEASNAADPWIPQALVAAAARHDHEFLLTALERSGSATPLLTDTVRVVAEHWARGRPDRLGTALASGAAQADGQVASAFWMGLDAGWQHERPADLNELKLPPWADQLQTLTSEGRLALTRLANRWNLGDEFAVQLKRMRGELLASAKASQIPLDQRLAAVDSLAELDPSPAEISDLIAVIVPQTPLELSQQILASLGQSTSPAVASQVLAHWPALTPTLRRSAVALLLTRPTWTVALLAALERGDLSRSELGVEQIQQLVNHPKPELAARARKLMMQSGILASTDRQAVLDEMLSLADRRGDVAAGRAVFEKQCGKCHRHGDLGVAIGPDLTGIALRSRREILADVLDPNRSVEGNFRQYLVETVDGRVLTGLLLSENQTSVEVLDSQAQRQVVLREQIESLTASNKSVMPEGFEKLPATELVDLLEFLAARGRYLPLRLSGAATVASDRGMFYARENLGETLVFDRWGAHTVGEVPFQLLDPQGGKVPNAVLLYGPEGAVSRQMPKSVMVACGLPARAIHLLGGVSGWGFPLGQQGSVSLVVRLHYASGDQEDHPLRNGEHLADYIRVIEVPGSKLAFQLGSHQLRYLSIKPGRAEPIAQIELVKGPDRTAPVVMALTLETLDEE